MKQRAHTFVKEILPRNLDDLKQKLCELGDEVQHGDGHRFAEIEGLHFLGCCILEAKNGKPPCLVVEASFDGGTRRFLRRFVERKRAALDRILAACVDYPPADASDEGVVEYLRKGLRADAVYIGNPGRSLPQIGDEEPLPAAFEEALDATRDLAQSRAERWRQAVARLRGEFPGLLPAPKRPLRVRLNPSSPRFVRRMREGAQLLLLALLWLAGLHAVARWTSEPWQLALVIGVPVLVAALAGAIVLREAPRDLKPRARLAVGGLALRELVSTLWWLVPAGGLVVAVFHWERQWVATALLWGLDGALALLLVTGVSAVAFTLSGGRVAAFATALALALLGWRFHASPTAGTLLAELVVAGVALLASVLAATAAYVVALRRRESDKEAAQPDEDLPHLERVTRREYQQSQSHLASEVAIEPGRLPMWTLRAVLRWVNLLARFWFNRGHLAGIPSIHFARFLILPERRSLVFLSNYDGRFDDYLGDFMSVLGVTAVWSNTVGFPRPFLLAFDGARNETAFKRFARNSQLESLIWYSAYPNRSVFEIDRASALREALGMPLEAGSAGYLARVRRWWRPPLDEAALAAWMEGR